MPNLPRKQSLSATDPQIIKALKTSWNDMVDYLKSCVVRGDGRTFYVDGGTGKVLDELIPIKVTSKTDTNTYTGDLYESGKDNSATTTGATIKVLNSDNGVTLPTDEFFLAKRMVWDISGTPTTYWTIDPSPTFEDIEDIEDQISDRGINKTFAVQSDSASYDEVLDDTIDYRRRHIECWIDQTSANDNTSPSVGEEWLNCLSADVDIVADSPYTVYVSSTDGSLNIRATASTTVQAIVWVRASDNVLTPCTCPCTSWPGDYPWATESCGGLLDEYTVTGNLSSRYDSEAIVTEWQEWQPLTAKWSIDEYRVSGNATAAASIYGGQSTCCWELSLEKRTLIYNGTQTGGPTTIDSAGSWAIITQFYNLGFVRLLNGQWQGAFTWIPGANVTGVKEGGATPVGNYTGENWTPYPGGGEFGGTTDATLTEAT
jgi:hypothetical protein